MQNAFGGSFQYPDDTQSLIYTGLESQNWKRHSPPQIQRHFLTIIFRVKTRTLPHLPKKINPKENKLEKGDIVA